MPANYDYSTSTVQTVTKIRRVLLIFPMSSWKLISSAQTLWWFKERQIVVTFSWGTTNIFLTYAYHQVVRTCMLQLAKWSDEHWKCTCPAYALHGRLAYVYHCKPKVIIFLADRTIFPILNWRKWSWWITMTIFKKHSEFCTCVSDNQHLFQV